VEGVDARSRKGSQQAACLGQETDGRGITNRHRSRWAPRSPVYQASAAALFFVEAGTFTGRSQARRTTAARGERVTVMVTADKLMVALIRGRSRGVLDDADTNVSRARSRERILLVHRTLARRRRRVIAVRRLP
jgi:hypothetical protein